MTDRRTRREFLLATACGAVATAGCLRSGEGDGSVTGTETGERTVNGVSSATETSSITEASTPVRPDCSEPKRPSFSSDDEFEAWNPDPPGDLSERGAVEYVTEFESKFKERELATRYRNARSIYVDQQGSTAVESANGGYIVDAEMGGYYNRPVGTATEHADLYYRVRYFLTATAVVRVEENVELYPRRPDLGEVVLCVPEERDGSTASPD